MGIVRTERMPTNHSNVKSLFHYTTDNEVVIERKTDVSGILRANHFERSEQSFRHGREVFNHAAHIDMDAIKIWMAQRGITKNWWFEFNQDPQFLRDFCNDPDNEVWRTRKGKI